MASTKVTVDEALAANPGLRATVELFRRKRAAEDLLGFVEYTYPNYRAARHHRIIASKLEAVARGEIDRLMIACPPRHGKSELASKRFIAWLLGRDPTKTIIGASYNSELAGDFGREVRNIVSSPEFGRVFEGVELATDSRASDRWHTSKGGSYVAAGVGTAITGRGAHVLVIDDPHKDREEADSETMRRRVRDWYTSTAYTRLAPGGAVIVIATRWHEDDLSGWLLSQAEKGSDDWHVIDLPAIALDDDDQMGRRPGDPLWPEVFGRERLDRIRANLPLRDWSALYQQRPTPDEGDYFKREWFRPTTMKEVREKGLRTYGASDYAVTEGRGDFTVHGVCGLDENDDIYLVDWWRGKTSSETWIEEWLRLVEEHSPHLWGEEAGQINKSVGPFIDRRMRETNTYCYREQFPSTSDKATRARAIQARAASRGVYVPMDAPWAADFLREVLTFPAGRHDDQVDVLSLMGRMLDRMSGVRPPKARERKRRSRYVEKKSPLLANQTGWAA